MSEGTDILTTLGVSKIRDAAGSGQQVRIQYVALGDGLGAAYAPSIEQTALVREQLRVEIERYYPVGTNAWYVTATFGVDVEPITVREVGFFDEDGDLIALWAGLDVEDNRRTGGAEYLIQHILAFEGVADGVLVVEAPLDRYLDHAVLKLRTDALMLDTQFRITQEVAI